MFLRRVKIRSYEKGLLFRDQEFKTILGPGRHWCVDPTGKTKVNIVSRRDPWLIHDDLDLIISSGMLGSDAQVVELSDNQRGLVWIDKRFAKIIGPGRHVLWNGFKDVSIEIIDTSAIKFRHKAIRTILESVDANNELITHQIAEGMVGILFLDGNMEEVLGSGCHVFWQHSGEVKVIPVDIRECTLDVNGQEIISQDKVSLRLNGLTTYRVVDPTRAITKVADFVQSLYRETQLALRAVVGTRDIDTLLSDKDSLAVRVKDIISSRAHVFGVEIVGFGIRDIILPGDMKELLNKVVESKKMAEANLITKREETAAMRSHANTAKLISSNPTLMRLKELELLEKVTAGSKLNILCGEGTLSDNILKLI